MIYETHCEICYFEVMTKRKFNYRFYKNLSIKKLSFKFNANLNVLNIAKKKLIILKKLISYFNINIIGVCDRNSQIKIN